MEPEILIGMVTDYLNLLHRKGKLDMKQCQGYLCGPPPMMRSHKEFTSEGMPNEEIFS